MGTRGPIPNRSEDLARPRERKGSDQIPVTKGIAMSVEIPEADPEWHPISLMLWESLATSGQSAYYQNSDWAFAFSLCEDLSRYKASGKRSSQMLQTIYSSMSNLLVTEGDRRRVRIELDAPQPDVDEASVTVLAEYRAGLAVVPETDE